MKKVLVIILAVVVNIITLPIQAISLIGINKRLEKADKNFFEEIDIVNVLRNGRELNYDQFVDLRKLLVSHYQKLLEGPARIFIKFGYWEGKYVPLVKDYLDEDYYGIIDAYISAELINWVAISC